MATKQLLQILLKSREGIKSGAIKVKDVVEEYLTSTGAKTISPLERFTINKEFNELAPSNVIDDVFGDFQGLQDDAGDVLTEAEKLAADEGVDIAETILPTRPFTDLVEQQRGVKLRGDESFGELTEKFGTKEEGLGSLFPKGETDSIFDIKNDKRQEVADFIKKMREANIKNKDIKQLFKDTGTDIEQGKRAATTLARAADMSADTKIKQELLSELDEMKMDKGPRFFQEEKMGFYDMRGVLDDLTTTINNRIQDDLIQQGVPEEKVDEIFFTIRDNLRRGSLSTLRNDPKSLVAKIKEEIDFENVKYDTDFWDKYVDEVMSLVRTPEPRFMHGGLA
tara:strand:- start:119 stop:1132 length:1014 start_codon:yes stop_codon:yes gene_type:complete